MNEATRAYIEAHLTEDVSLLALGKVATGVDKAFALRQIEARQLLQKKVPSWSANAELWFPPRLSLEQCSSEATALYKAALVGGDTFADLTGGLGIDSWYLSKGFKHGHYGELRPELCDLARHNFDVLNADIEVHNESAEDYLGHCPVLDLIYIDPARRDLYGRKTVAVSDCTPDVVQLQDIMLEKAKTVMVKLSPMLDLHQALSVLHGVREVHVVAVTNECKELLLLQQRDAVGPVSIHCVNLLTGQEAVEFTKEEEDATPLCLADTIGKYLYEPNAALMKAGCFKVLAQRYGVEKLHKNSNLYTSDHLVANFPGRIFEVEGWAPFNKKVGQTLLSDVAKASISVRNFPLSVAELRKSFKLADGDSTYLFATTLKGEKKVLIKTKKAASI